MNVGVVGRRGRSRQPDLGIVMERRVRTPGRTHTICCQLGLVLPNRRTFTLGSAIRMTRLRVESR